jgi:SOS response regulatory protein OraA/RecX
MEDAASTCVSEPIDDDDETELERDMLAQHVAKSEIEAALLEVGEDNHADDSAHAAAFNMEGCTEPNCAARAIPDGRIEGENETTARAAAATEATDEVATN